MAANSKEFRHDHDTDSSLTNTIDDEEEEERNNKRFEKEVLLDSESGEDSSYHPREDQGRRREQYGEEAAVITACKGKPDNKSSKGVDTKGASCVKEDGGNEKPTLTQSQAPAKKVSKWKSLKTMLF